MLCDRTSQNSVTQTSLYAEITLRYSLASLKLLQTFQNTSSHPLEVNYTVPIDPSLVITSLRAIYQDGTKLECKIMEKEKAQEKFQDKISKGHQPILGTTQEEDLELFIGHLPSGNTLSIEIEYGMPLQVNQNSWKFEMPEGFTTNSSLHYHVDLFIHSDVALAEWKSTWDFDYSFEGFSLKGLFDSQSKSFNSQRLEVSFRTNENPSPKILIQHDGDQYAAILSFIPSCSSEEDIDDYEAIGEFLFIIDRSGSMSGNRIELAKEAASLFLKSLSHKSKFNIISFGDSFSLLYPNSVFANSSNVSDAISKISRFSADMGGTEIFQPLQLIYQKEPEPGFSRFIFLLTDGDVSSPDMVLDLVLKNQSKGKVYSFGIEDANEHLIRGTAKNGNGESFYIRKAVDIGKNVIKALSICVSPFISDVKITWDCEFAPSLTRINSVSFGNRLCVFALARSLPDSECVFTCFDSFKNRNLRFEIIEKSIIPGNEIFKLWAKQRIFDDPENCLEVSLKYQVISPKTAYFLAKKSQEALNEEILPAKINTRREEPDYGMNKCLFSLPMASNVPLFRSYQPRSEEECEEDEELFGEPCFEINCDKQLNYELRREEEEIRRREEEEIRRREEEMRRREGEIRRREEEMRRREEEEMRRREEEIRRREEEMRRCEEEPRSRKLKHEKKLNYELFCEEKVMSAVIKHDIFDVENEKFRRLEDKIDFFDAVEIPQMKTAASHTKAHLDVVLCQDSEGFWQWESIIRVIKGSQEIIELKDAHHNQLVVATSLALAYLNKYCLGSKEEWILIEKKALKWIKKEFPGYSDLILRFTNALA